MAIANSVWHLPPLGNLKLDIHPTAKLSGNNGQRATKGFFMSMLRMPAVKKETGHRSHASIYSAIKDGLFTRPVSIGQRAVGWPSDEVEAINRAKIAEKSEAEIRELINRLHSKRVGLGEV